MENVGCRGNRIAAIEEGEAAAGRGGDEPEGCGFIAADVAVGTRGNDGCWHFVTDAEHFRRLAEVVACLERLQVRFEYGGVALELLLCPARRRVHLAAVEPKDEPERIEVAGAKAVLRVQGRAFERELVLARDANANQLVGIEASIVQRILGIRSLFQVDRVELIFIDDEESTRAQVAHIRL